MQIRPVDFGADEQFTAWYAVAVAVRSHERPHFVPTAAGEVRALLTHLDPGEVQQHYAVWDAGDIVGCLSVWLPQDDNLETMWADVAIHPDHRRRGHGSRCLAKVFELAGEHGRTRIVGSACYPPQRAADHPHRVFLENNGFRLGNSAMTRQLELPVHPELLDALWREALQAGGAAYRVATFERVPEELVPGVCALAGLVAADGPSGEIDWEPRSLDPQTYRDRVELDRRLGRTCLTSVAVERASGEVVAYTELFLPRGVTRCHQAGTLVRGDHRGHRLGLAVKVANLRALQDDHPDRVDIITNNADANDWMIAINERLGFVAIEVEGEFYRTR